MTRSGIIAMDGLTSQTAPFIQVNSKTISSIDMENYGLLRVMIETMNLMKVNGKTEKDMGNL